MPEPRRFFIVHMQKSAGTSLRDRLRNQFPESAIYPNRTDGADKRVSVISLRHLLERWDARGDEIRLVAGHFPLATTEVLGAPFVTLTVLRPPVERTLSYLRHQRGINKADAEKTLEEIYEDPFRFNALIRNHMTRMLSLTREELIAGDGVLGDVEDTPERLERAKRALETLDCFGLQPHFEEFCRELEIRYSIDLGEPTRSNATEADARVRTISLDVSLPTTRSTWSSTNSQIACTTSSDDQESIRDDLSPARARLAIRCRTCDHRVVRPRHSARLYLCRAPHTHQRRRRLLPHRCQPSGRRQGIPRSRRLCVHEGHSAGARRRAPTCMDSDPRDSVRIRFHDAHRPRGVRKPARYRGRSSSWASPAAAWPDRAWASPPPHWARCTRASGCMSGRCSRRRWRSSRLRS